MIRPFRIAASVSALAIAMPALAQVSPDAAAETAKEDIVVTAARSILPANALPLTIDIVGKSELDQQMSISGSVIDSIATLTPSFSPTRQKMSGAGETLRGRSPLYAINGIPQTTPLRDGSRDGFTIDGFFIDRVEVIYGSNALQGVGGTGGIVNQVTVAPPTAEGFGGRVLLQGNADDHFRKDGLGGKAAGLIQYRKDRFDVTVGAAYEKRAVFYDGDGRRVGVNLTQGETQDSRTLSLFGRFGYQLGDTGRIDLIASRYEMKVDGDYIAVAGNKTAGLPTSATRGNPPLKPAESRTESVALSVTDTDLGGGNFVSQLFFNRTRDTFGGEPVTQATFQDPTIAPVGTLFDQSQNRSRKLGFKISYERALPGFEALTGTLGFDALFDKTEQRLIATNRIWVPPSDFRSLAPFAQLNLALFDEKLRVAGGARWENVQIKIDDFRTLASTTVTAANPTAYGGVTVGGGKPKFDDVLVNGGIIFEPWKGIRAYASYAEGFTVADIGRITRSIGKPGIDLDNYLDISPVISNNREVGVEVKHGPLDASVTYFWSSSNQGQILVAGSDGIFNVIRQRVEIEGLELNAGVRMPIDGVRLSVGYAHIKGRYDASATPDGTAGTDLDGANISPDRLNLAASFNRGAVSARVQTNFYLSRTFRSSEIVLDPRNSFGGYDLTDASIRYQTRLGGFTFSVQNLFDKQYIDYASSTQRPTDNFFNFAGRGRNFTLSWDYRF